MCNRVLLAGRLTSQVAGSVWHNGYIIFRDMTRIWGRKHKNKMREKVERKSKGGGESERDERKISIRRENSRKIISRRNIFESRLAFCYYFFFRI